MVHEDLNAFFFIQWIERGTERHKFRVTNRGLFETDLARSIVPKVIRTLHFASWIVAWYKQYINILSKKKITCVILRPWLFSLLVYQSITICLKLSVFSQLLQLDPNLIGEFVWLATTAQKQATKVCLRQFQACPPPIGHLSFCSGKAANAPRWYWAFIPKPHGGA